MAEVQPFAAVCNRDLSINDHYAVYSKVRTLSARWNRFAQFLHLEQDKIGIIGAKHGSDPESCMSEVLDNWLRRNYNHKKYGTPCWRLVCVAVKEGGADTALAEKIAREHSLAAGASSKIYVLPERNYPLLKKIHELQGKFADALQETEECFKRSTNPNLFSSMINYIVRHIIDVLGPCQMNPTTAMAFTEEFEHIKTISKLFNSLQHKYLPWFNYKLIVQLVNKFLSENSTLKMTWSSYEQKLQDYFRNGGVCELKDVEAIQSGYFHHTRPPTPGKKVLIAKVDRDDYKEDDLFFFRNAIPEELNVSEETQLYFSLVTTVKKSEVSKQTQQPSSDNDYENKYRKLIEEMLYTHYDNLKCCLDGLDAFTDRMISSNLIAARSRYKSFDKIMSEFQDKLQSSRRVTTIYDTFVDTLKEFYENFNELRINWSVKSSVLCKTSVHQQDEAKVENDEIHETGHLKNGLQNVIQLRKYPVIKKHQLTLAEMRSIILYETIPCNFFIITFSDLHSSRKSTLIRDYLEKVTYTIETPSRFKYTCNEKGLSVYNATLLKQCPNNEYLWFAPTKALKEAVSCGSAILCMSFHYGYELQMLFDHDAPSDVFKDEILDSHLDFVCSNLKEIIQYSHGLQQILSSAAIHINIIDGDMRKGAMEFLSLISHHLSNDLYITWLTMDDVKELRDRRTGIESKIWSTLHYAAEIPVMFIITCSTNNTRSDRDEAKETLLKAINKEIKRPSLHSIILVLDPSSSDDMEKLNHELDKMVNAQCLAKRHIKLSWLFLCSALLSSSEDVVISYCKLKDTAEKIGIKNREYEKFLKTFTKFMSILYLPAFKPLKNVVILRPVEFINKLSTLFEKPKGFNGIYNMEQLNEKIPNKELADSIVNALCSLGLALETTAEKVDTRTSSLANPSTPLVFVPLARGDSSHMYASKLSSLYILFNTGNNLPIPDCLSFFASELLTLKGSSLLTGEVSKPNIFQILLQITHHDYIVTFIFRGTCIEVIVENYEGRGDGVLGKILHSCKEALIRMSSVLRKFSYKLALACLASDQVPSGRYIDLSRKGFEYFPTKKGFEYFPTKRLCHKCEESVSLLRKKWREVIQKMYDKEVKERDRIKFDKLLDLAHDLGHVVKSSQSLKILADQLGIAVEREFLTVLSQSCPSWQRVFTIFLLWEKKEEPTKEKLKIALTRLGHPTSILD